MMSNEEMLQRAQAMRERGFPPMEQPPEQRPVTEKVLHLPSANGRSVTVYEIRPQRGLPEHCPFFINYHGGGFVKSRADRDGVYCAWLADLFDALVWDVDYALAPEEPFPAAVEDAWAVAQQAFEQAAELGADPERILLLGHSAGGNLVADVCLLARERGIVKPAAVLMEYFPADMAADPMDKLSEAQRADEKEARRAEMGRMYNLFYTREHDPKEVLISPIFASQEQLADFPDALVLSAGKDKLCEEDEQFAARLAAAGVTVTARRFPRSQHGFTINRGGEWREALALHAAFFDAHLRPGKETTL